MKRWKVVVGIAVLSLAITLAAFFTQKSERRKIDGMVFSEMAQNRWDLKGELLWGYFFTSSRKPAIDRGAGLLKKFGYRFVDIHQDENGLWWLHVEKIERHTLDSMAGRNVRLSWFAKAFGISTYDGWDVGQVQNAKKG